MVMAPKRKERKERKIVAPAPTLSPRKTRSATAGKRVAPPPAPARSPAKKKAKLVAEKRKNEVSDGEKGKGSRLKGKGRISGDEAPIAPPPPATAVADGGSSKTIIIEACKQCNSFKTRANMVKEGLEKAVPGISVSVNPEKPRRGCFEIRKESGEVFVSLLNMPRPFTPMKKLDMEKVIEDIVKMIT